MLLTFSLADPRGRQGRPPPGSKFFHFHAVFGKKICKIPRTWELAPPPRENPGSTTGLYIQYLTKYLNFTKLPDNVYIEMQENGKHEGLGH